MSPGEQSNVSVDVPGNFLYFLPSVLPSDLPIHVGWSWVAWRREDVPPSVCFGAWRESPGCHLAFLGGVWGAGNRALQKASTRTAPVGLTYYEL